MLLKCNRCPQSKRKVTGMLSLPLHLPLRNKSQGYEDAYQDKKMFVNYGEMILNVTKYGSEEFFIVR